MKEDTISDKECKKLGLLMQLAGLVDADGTINIVRRPMRNGKFSYHQSLAVSNTNVKLMEWLVEHFGGSMPNAAKRTKHKENSKDDFQWRLTGYKSYKIIKKIHPYLIIKQEQADLTIELYEKVSRFHYCTNKPRPVYKTELSEKLYWMCISLNKRGKSEEQSEPNEEPKLIRRKVTLEEFV